MSNWSRVKAGAKTAAKYAVMVIGVLSLGRAAQGATLNVPGSYSTIQAAANAANAGDTIVVSSGTYNERVTVTRAGSSSAPITFQASPRRSVKMKGFDLNAAYVKVSGFEITNTDTGLAGCGVVVRKDGDIVDDCYIHDMMEKGIMYHWNKPWPVNTKMTNNYIYGCNAGINANGDNSLLENNEIVRLIQRTSGMDCDYTRIFGNNVVVRGNYFHGSLKSEIGTAHVDGFQSYDNNGEYLQNALIENNRVFDCAEGMMGEAKVYNNTYNITFRNNVFGRCWSWTVDLHYFRNVKFYNNTVVGMEINGVGFRTGTTGEVKNNVFYKAGSIYFADSGATISADHNLIYTPGTTQSATKFPNDILNVDPKFVNFAADDYHLLSGSPAIDKASNLSIASDLDGTARPQGSSPDIGSYEFKGGTTPPPMPSLSIGNVTINEGNSGSTIANFTVNLSAASASNVTVNYATADGSATVADSDYAAANGTLSIPAGTTSKTVAVMVNGDTKVEGDENFYVNLTNAANATIADAQGVGTIKNDDTATVPAISVADASIVEGNSGTTALTFTVTLSAAATNTVNVNYATADGSATLADNDYQAANGSLSFAPGTTSKTVTVNVVGDTKYESNEYFALNLSSPVNATISRAQAAGSIVSDDAVNPDGLVSYLKLDETAGLTATDASGMNNSGTLANINSWTDGQINGAVHCGGSAGYVQVPINGLSANAGSVAAWVRPGGFTSTAQFIFGHATASWNNRIQLYFADATGNLSLGLGSSHTTLTNIQALPLSVWSHVALTWDGANYKVYVNGILKGSGTYTGLTSMAATADFGNNGMAGDRAEGFNGCIDEARVYNRVLSDADVAGLVNVDQKPSISITGVKQAEGDSGTTPFVFAVALDHAYSQPVSVNYTTNNDTAIAGKDYTAASGVLTIPAGSTSGSITVGVVGDTIYEHNSQFTIVLSNAVNGTIAKATGTGIIQNDEALPKLSVNDISIAEGNSGTKTVNFTVSLAFAIQYPVTFDYATADGTATVANNDYAAKSGSVTIPAGAITATIPVTINGDTTKENNETFSINLSNAVDAGFFDPQGICTISDDDAVVSTLPSVSISDPVITEGDSGTKWAEFIITLSKASTSTVSVYYITANGSAVAPTDYIAENGTVKFTAGTTSRKVSVALVGDKVKEAQEKFAVALSKPVNCTIAKATGTCTVNDND